MIRLAALLLAALLCCSPAAAQSAHDLLAGETRGINPRYLLMDANGRSVSSEDFRGRLQLISFGYTFCPDVCPTTLAEMAAVLRRARSRWPTACRRSSSPSTRSATRRSMLQAPMSEFFDPRILGLTGSPALVRRAADHFSDPLRTRSVSPARLPISTPSTIRQA
jgi:protein SCO1/2